MIKRTLILMLFSVNVLMAQGDLKVGLALSGGGAKGMAHVGVLRILEENNIHIDYISGTSMGGVVGSMYALGYSVDDIEAYLLSVDWEALMNNDLPRNRINIMDRKTNDRYLLEFDVTDSSIVIPDAFNSGQYMLKELSFLTWPAHGKEDFSKFDIPFLCVATNLETGEEVILEKGNLAEALRASVAFPSVFSPYQIDSTLYADGGVRNNLPIAVLKEVKGMDFVIAVDVQSELYKKEELNSFLKILDQVGSFNNAINYQKQKKMADVILRPEGIENFTIADYDKSLTLIKMGEDETKRQWDKLVSLPRVQEDKEVKSTSLKKEDMIYISTVDIEGNTSVTDRYIRSKLHLKKAKLFSYDQLEKGVDQLYGTRNFDDVHFSLLPEEEGYKLKVNVREKSVKTNLRFGLHYDDDFGIGVLANVSMRNQLLENSRFNLEVVLSENARGSMTYVYDRGFIPAIGVEFAFHRFGTRLYYQREPITSLTYQDFSVNAFIASTIAENYRIGAGVRLENVDYLDEFDIVELETNSNYIQYYGFLDFDSFDRSYKPKKGLFLKGEVRTISKQLSNAGFATPSTVIYARYIQAFKLSDKLGVNLQAVAATTIGSDLDLPYKIYLGGLGENYNNFIFPFLGYRYMELFGRNAAFIRADIFIEVVKDHFITFKGNVGKLEPTVDGLLDTDILLDGYGVSYGYNSALGPLEFTLITSSNHSDLLTYLSLGFWF